VVVNHNHTPDAADNTAAAIEAAGGTALAIAADVSSRREYQSMVRRMLAAYGHWDVLVNNAAVAITKPFAQIIEADFDLSFAVNVRASSTACSAVRATRPGRRRAGAHTTAARTSARLRIGLLDLNDASPIV
jgi:NAD(P)-dependent dehydrogenase (short-subunit alcohol dehydrogenase family)